MTRYTASKLWKSFALAMALALLTAGVAMAQDNVTVTDVTIDKFGTVSPDGVIVRLTGTITCDAVGPAEELRVSVRQQDAEGEDNLQLLDFPCSTEPTAYSVPVDNLTCEATQEPQDCFHPGAAIATVSKGSRADPTVVAQQRVILRYSR